VIVAVPEQVTIWAGSERDVLTSYRWWCSVCRVSAAGTKASHADLALKQSEWHLAIEQCHAEGQLSLVAPTAQDWGFPG
jgi:hypothetical protein